MAGDWIKMRSNLDTDPRVIEMAVALSTSELHVVGMLWKVWSWADSHTLDGNAIRVTDVTLDRFTGCTGFAEMLRKVGWLDGSDNVITFPRFTEHNGKTAKKRAETKERVQKHRNVKRVTDVTQLALPEKRREEKSIKKQKEHPWLEDEEFSEVLATFRRQSQATHNWIAGDDVVQAWMYELSRHSIEDAKSMLRFSTSAGAKKPITNGDHNRERGSPKRIGYQPREVEF
jgi:hypothetical protein